jgi:hypothetical protein
MEIMPSHLNARHLRFKEGGRSSDPHLFMQCYIPPGYDVFSEPFFSTARRHSEISFYIKLAIRNFYNRTFENVE